MKEWVETHEEGPDSRSGDSSQPAIHQFRGESSRSLHIRHQQHMSDYTRNDDSGFMYNHIETEHQGLKGPNAGVNDFKVEIVGKDKDPMHRIVRETVRINSC